MISLDQHDITKICGEAALRFQLPGAACGRMRVLVLGRNLRSLADGGQRGTGNILAIPLNLNSKDVLADHRFGG